MMTDFNTGNDITTSATRPQRNPYDILLVIIWAVGLVGAGVLVIISVLINTDGYATTAANVANILSWAALFGTIGGITLVVHLASLAVRWKPAPKPVMLDPED